LVGQEQEDHKLLLKKLLSEIEASPFIDFTNSGKNQSKDKKEEREESIEKVKKIITFFIEQIEEFDTYPTLWGVPMSRTTWTSIATSLASGVVVVVATFIQILYGELF